MPTVLSIDPVTRLEGHLKIEVTVDYVKGIQQVVDAHAVGTMFRGLETMLANRNPQDAPHGNRVAAQHIPTSSAAY